MFHGIDRINGFNMIDCIYYEVFYLGVFYLFVSIVVFSSPLTLSKCHWHFFTSGRSLLTSEYHGTAPSACTVFLRDVATSRQSSNKFGSALDFRNVIKGLTPSG